jgi:hypothetical protein
MVKASIELSLKDTLESFKIDVPGVNGKWVLEKSRIKVAPRLLRPYKFFFEGVFLYLEW